MADKKSTIIDVGLKALRDFLNATVKNQEPPAEAKQLKLEQVPLDDLKREKIVLDQEEKKTLTRLRDLESRKRQLFSEGVQGTISEREQFVLARKIKEMDTEAAGLDSMLQVISKQMRVINGLVQVKERSLVLSSITGTIVSQLSMDDVLRYVNMASADGEFQMTKFDDLLNAMDINNSIAPRIRDDDDVKDIVKAMQRAREAGESSPEKIEEVLKDLSKKDQSFESNEIN